MSGCIRYDPRRHVMQYTTGEVNAMSVEDRREYGRALSLYWQQLHRLLRDWEFDQDAREDREFGGHW